MAGKDPRKKKPALSPGLIWFFTMFGAGCVLITVLLSWVLQLRRDRVIAKAQEVAATQLLADALTPMVSRELFAGRTKEMRIRLKDQLARHPQVEDAVVFSQSGAILFDTKGQRQHRRSWTWQKDESLIYVERPLVFESGSGLALKSKTTHLGKLILGVRPPEPGQARQFLALVAFARTLANQISEDMRQGQYVEVGNLTQNLVATKENVKFTQLMLPNGTLVSYAREGLERNKAAALEGQKVDDPAALQALKNLGPAGFSVERINQPYQTPFLVITVAVEEGGRRLGALRIGYEDKEALKTIEDERLKTGLIAGVVALLGMLVATGVSWRMARLLGALDDSRRTTGNLYESKRRELLKALAVQKSMLGNIDGRHGPFVLSSAYHPAEELCGDFFDIVSIGHLRAILLADVSGHGAASAMVTAALKTLFRKTATVALHRGYTSPQAMLKELDEGLRDLVPSNMHYVTGLLVVLDLEQNEVNICTAGHPPAIYLKNGEVQELPNRGLGPLNLLDLFDDNHEKNEDIRLTLYPGDRLLLFTDGLTEVHDKKGHEFAETGVISLMQEHSKMEGKILLKTLHEKTLAFTGGSGLLDDQAMVLVELQK